MCNRTTGHASRRMPALWVMALTAASNQAHAASKEPYWAAGLAAALSAEAVDTTAAGVAASGMVGATGLPRFRADVKWLPLRLAGYADEHYPQRTPSALAAWQVSWLGQTHTNQHGIGPFFRRTWLGDDDGGWGRPAEVFGMQWLRSTAAGLAFAGGPGGAEGLRWEGFLGVEVACPPEHWECNGLGVMGARVRTRTGVTVDGVFGLLDSGISVGYEWGRGWAT